MGLVQGETGICRKGKHLREVRAEQQMLKHLPHLSFRNMKLYKVFAEVLSLPLGNRHFSRCILSKLLQCGNNKEPPKRKGLLPEHGLVPVGLCSSCHVFSSQSPAHHGVVMVLHTSAAQFDVTKAGSIPCLGENQPVSTATGKASTSARTKNIGKRKVEQGTEFF